MDYVLDTLLESLLQLVPCKSARVLLLESEVHLFLARERQQDGNQHSRTTTWSATDNRFLMQVLKSRNSAFISNTQGQQNWQRFEGHAHFQSWLCVPLVASGHVVGLLSLGDSHPDAFTPEHLRLAESLAIPAAVAIQNARLYERADIYGAELEKRVAELQDAQRALSDAQKAMARSENRFARIFEASPVAFSLTALDDRRFLEVNRAFELRYGYTREQLLRSTICDTVVWETEDERDRVADEIRLERRPKHGLTRFRTRSGQILETRFAADIVELDGCQCLLTISEDAFKSSASLAVHVHKAAGGR